MKEVKRWAWEQMYVKFNYGWTPSDLPGVKEITDEDDDHYGGYEWNNLYIRWDTRGYFTELPVPYNWRRYYFINLLTQECKRNGIDMEWVHVERCKM